MRNSVEIWSKFSTYQHESCRMPLGFLENTLNNLKICDEILLNSRSLRDEKECASDRSRQDLSDYTLSEMASLPAFRIRLDMIVRPSHFSMFVMVIITCFKVSFFIQCTIQFTEICRSSNEIMFKTNRRQFFEGSRTSRRCGRRRRPRRSGNGRWRPCRPTPRLSKNNFF